ncbi:hypothetical protein [Paraclostridium sordellii]
MFKIQANMDKNHRDRIAFLRICSGDIIDLAHLLDIYLKEMKVYF